MNLKKVKYKDLFIGMKVFDVDSINDFELIKGVVVECDDIHNIMVEFDGGGSGLYCLDKGCIECDDSLYYDLNELRKKKLNKILK